MNRNQKLTSIGLVFCLPLTSCSRLVAKTDAASSIVVPVRAIVAAARDVPLEISAVGNVEAIESVEVKSRIAGQIKGVAFAEGQTVSKGQLLFTMDSEALQRQAANTWNLSPTYDRGRLSVRLGLSYNGASIYQYQYQTQPAGTPDFGPKGPNGDQYLYPHLQVDAQGSFKMRKDLSLLVQGLNLTNEVFGFYNGSPVYVDGRLIGAVSYSLGSFSKEPIAGITPIEEMTAATTTLAPRPAAARAQLDGRRLLVAWLADGPQPPVDAGPTDLVVDSASSEQCAEVLLEALKARGWVGR